MLRMLEIFVGEDRGKKSSLEWKTGPLYTSPARPPIS